MRARFAQVVAIALLVGLVGLTAIPAAAQTITLRGASQFDDNHSFNQTMLKFAEQVQKYYGKPVNFVLHRNRELGLEKDYFAWDILALQGDREHRNHVRGQPRCPSLAR